MSTVHQEGKGAVAMAALVDDRDATRVGRRFCESYLTSDSKRELRRTKIEHHVA